MREEIADQIVELERKIAVLPEGSISKKTKKKTIRRQDNHLFCRWSLFYLFLTPISTPDSTARTPIVMMSPTPLPPASGRRNFGLFGTVIVYTSSPVCPYAAWLLYPVILSYTLDIRSFMGITGLTPLRLKPWECQLRMVLLSE